MTAPRPRLRRVPGTFAVHRLEPGAPLPPALEEARPVWVARTEDELSIVCPEDAAVDAPRSEGGWACLRCVGTLDFAWTGILAGLTGTLAGAGVALFALSTFDTDYLLVKAAAWDRAAETLRAAGYEVDG